MKFDIRWLGLVGVLVLFFLSLRKGLGRVHVDDEQKAEESGLLNCGVTHKNPVGHMPLILVTLIPKPQSTMPHPLLRGNHLSVVSGELPLGNQLWLNGQDTCWDNGFGML